MKDGGREGEGPWNDDDDEEPGGNSATIRESNKKMEVGGEEEKKMVCSCYYYTSTTSTTTGPNFEKIDETFPTNRERRKWWRSPISLSLYTLHYSLLSIYVPLMG